MRLPKLDKIVQRSITLDKYSIKIRQNCHPKMIKPKPGESIN
jgi:hypothetical protein